MRSQSKVLIAALGAAFVLGAGVSMAHSEAHIEWLNGLSVLLSTFLTFAWYRYDSEARSYRRSYALNIGVIAVTFVGLPYYLFRSRGWTAGLQAHALLIGLAAGLAALLVAGALFGVWIEDLISPDY
jgi:hypothetical protein